MTIYDVTEDKKNITLGKYCGQKNPGTFYSSGRYMIVVFKSDNGDSHSGFLAHYQTNIQQGSGEIISSNSKHTHGVVFRMSGERYIYTMATICQKMCMD